MKKGDLAVVAADGGIEEAIRGLLTRVHALGMRELENVEYAKLKALDSRTFGDCVSLTNPYKRTHTHVLVMLDQAWDKRNPITRTEMEETVETRLRPTWGERAACIVIEPELEVWLWSNSPHVATEMGWENAESLKDWLIGKSIWKAEQIKPSDPKEAYRQASREKRHPISNSIFRTLASKVSLSRCNDPAFEKLRVTLKRWFPVMPKL